VYELKAAALGGGRQRSDGALVLIDYPHIRPRAVVHASTAELRAARISLPALDTRRLRAGASDRVPEALQAVGVPIELLGPDTLARGDLSRYDAIVIGKPGVTKASAALVARARAAAGLRPRGGLMITIASYRERSPRASVSGPSSSIGTPTAWSASGTRSDAPRT